MREPPTFRLGIDSARLGRLQALKELSAEGMNVHEVGEHGETLLHHAAAHGRLYCCEWLLEQGLDSMAMDRDGDTPMHSAALWGHPECLEVLIDEPEVDMDVRNHAGRTPLHLCARRNRFVCLEMLLRSGATPAVQCSEGRTALHDAAALGNTLCLDLLVAADRTMLNVRDGRGETPVHLACAFEQKDALETLINYEADVT